MQIMRQVKLYCDLLCHHKKSESDDRYPYLYMQIMRAPSRALWLNLRSPRWTRALKKYKFKIGVKSILKYILGKIQLLDTKANQPCGHLSQRLSQTAASCSCSCSSDESSWLHFPRPLFPPLSDYSHENIPYLNFLPTLSQNFVNGLLVPTYICISWFHPPFKV